MFDKSIVLNFKISGQEFAIGTAISVFSGILLNLNSNDFSLLLRQASGIFSLISLVGFAAALVFFAMGFHKLYYKSLFSNEANLYMSLPVSNLQVVVSKIFVASFWLIIFLAILVFSVFAAIIKEANLLNFLVGSFLVEGIPAERIGSHMVFLLWADIISILVFSATLLFAIILANTRRVKRFKIGVNILIVLGCFAINGLIFQNINQKLEYSLLSLVLPLAMLSLFTYLSTSLLTKSYNLE